MEKDSSESDVFFPDRRQPVAETAARRTHRRAQRRKTLTRPTLEHLQTWAKPRPSWDTAVRTPPSAKAWTIRPSPFFPGTPPTRGIFSTRDATRSALRDPRFRVSPPRGTSASVTYVSYPDGPSVRAVSGARRRPSPPVQHSSTRHALPTHAALFVNIVSFFRRLWRLAGLGSARHSRRRRRTTRALASLLRQPLQRQPPQLDRRARPSQIHRPPQPRRGRRRHPRSRRSAVAMSGDFTRRTRRCDTARLLPTSARDENERRRGGRGERRRPDRPRTLYDHAPVY